jgi:predicted metalloprotease
MQDDDLRALANTEDQRGARGVATGCLGIGTGALVVLTLIGWETGIDPRALIGGAEMLSGGGQVAPQSAPGRQGMPNGQTGNFVARVLGETEDVWSQVLPRLTNHSYEKPRLCRVSKQKTLYLIKNRGKEGRGDRFLFGSFA